MDATRRIDLDVEVNEAPRNPNEIEPNYAEARSLKRELLEELAEGYKTGFPLRPEDLLIRWPTNPTSDPDVASLLFVDFQERSDRGENPSVSEYEERFPQHKESLAGIFSQRALCRSLARSGSVPGVKLSLPSVGDVVFGFRLLHELGTGAFAKVFLAEQSDLGGRPVVLKTSDLTGDEPQTLAQLQHTNIVPIHSVHEDANIGLRVVCMPYFGGAALSRVLQVLWNETRTPTRGAQLIDVLDRVRAPAIEEVRKSGASDRAPKVTPIVDDAQRKLLTNGSYIRAAVWIVARLAEGLEHAHTRGILHRDIKPSNVLLTNDGQPMLLDFNLAHNDRDRAAEATLGGTVAYMAPEHLRALKVRTPASIQQVDHRSDVYSLGMVLFEMLTGHNPFDQSGSYAPLPAMIEAMAVERSRAAPSVREKRNDVPWSLESIVRKCLSPQPERRYQRAAHLAEDLLRFLDDRSLLHAPELSLHERVQKWFRRHPRLTSSGAVAALAGTLILGVGGAWFAAQQRLAMTRENLAFAQTQENKRKFQEGTVRALCLVNANTDLQDYNDEGLRVCEQTLNLFEVLERDDWQELPAWKRLNSEERMLLAEDARELLTLLAWARVRQQPEDRYVIRDALALLEKAETIEGLSPSPALEHDRASYLQRLGDTEADKAFKAAERARRLEPCHARDHYLLAVVLIRKGTGARERAIEHLDRAIQQNPHYFWSWFQRGICRQHSGDLQLAAADFGVCIGLWPEFAWAHFNLGCVLALSGRRDESIRSYSTAIQLDPAFVDAYLNRGLAYLEMKSYSEALDDFTQALAFRSEDAALLAGRGMALEGLQRTEEADTEFNKSFARLSSLPVAAQNRIRCGYGFSVYRRSPAAAERAFSAVLKLDPNHPQALYGCALPAAEQGRAEEAVALLDRAVAAAPDMMEARRHRAIQLARLGRFEEAFLGIDQCLDREPESSATVYSAACVAALAAVKKQGTSAGTVAHQNALTLLKKALKLGQSREVVLSDPDFSGLRDHPDVVKLLQPVRE